MKINRHQLLQRVLIIIVAILMSPIYLVIGIKDFLFYVYRSLTLSIRKKIAFDYMVLMIIFALITVVVVEQGYIIFKVHTISVQMSKSIHVLAENYREKELSDFDFQERLDRIALDNAVKLFLGFETSDGKKMIFTSTGTGTSDYADGLFDALNRSFREGEYFATRLMSLADGGGRDILRLQLKVTREQFSHDVFFLKSILLLSYAVSFFIIGIIGSYRSKQVLLPIYQMTKTAEKISIQELGARLDISKTKYELRDLAITLNEMLDRLAEEYERQKRFVSDVSHELRTPISIVNGYSRMLERWGKEDEKILDESIIAIHSEARNMQELVENLLTLVRSDNRTLIFEGMAFDLKGLIEEISKEMAMINEKNHDFSVQIEESIQVYLDYSKIKQALRIFIDNAVKYTPENGNIQVKAYKSGGFCHIHVKDTGIGISKNDLPHLFERFYRSDESRTRATGGHGLGLAIAKAIIIGHNGRIRVKSKENEGSEFIISLPIKMKVEDAT